LEQKKAMTRIAKGAGYDRKSRGGRLRQWLQTIAAAMTLAAPLVTARADTAPPSAPLTVQDHADLQRIATYLNSIGTMTARFHQRAANGGTASGWVWMERPGRMRFQYDPPNPILLIADRFYVYYIDTQLAEVSEVGLKSTPAWFLLRVPISFDDLEVTRFERAGDIVQIAVIDPKAPDNGSLTMTFTTNPLSLRQWTVVDQQHHVTTVSLSQQQFGMALDPKLFVYQNPYYRSRSTDN
jgi:outer membrane lipoprotein-sorting protein